MGEERNPAIIDFAAARKWSDTPDRVKEILGIATLNWTISRGTNLPF